MKCIAPYWMSKFHKYFCISMLSLVLLNVIALQLGVLANKLATAMNDDLMPISVDITKIDRPYAYVTISDNTKLAFLGDVYSFRIPSEARNTLEIYALRGVNWIIDGNGPGLYHCSIGDLLIWTGSILLPASLLVFLPILGNILTKDYQRRHMAREDDDYS